MLYDRKGIKVIFKYTNHLVSETPFIQGPEVR